MALLNFWRIQAHKSLDVKYLPSKKHGIYIIMDRRGVGAVTVIDLQSFCNECPYYVLYGWYHTCIVIPE